MTPGLPADLPVVDHHAHLSAQGQGIEAVRRFAAAGGTHLFLATQDYGTVPFTPAEYNAQFDETVRLARAALEATGVTVYCVLAPYPVDLLRQEEKLGSAGAVALQKAALDLAAERVRRQEAVGLGEVGRIHFAVDTSRRDAAEEVFRHACAVAHDAACPVIVHSEDLDARGYAEVARTARSAGLPEGRVVKHYAREVLTESERAGIVPSYLARRDIVRAAIAEAAPWFLETDYLDDPSRPGAVLDLTTVPRRARAIADADPEGVERLRGPFVESVRRVYGFVPEVRRPGGAR